MEQNSRSRGHRLNGSAKFGTIYEACSSVAVLNLALAAKRVRCLASPNKNALSQIFFFFFLFYFLAATKSRVNLKLYPEAFITDSTFFMALA